MNTTNIEEMINQGKLEIKKLEQKLNNYNVNNLTEIDKKDYESFKFRKEELEMMIIDLEKLKSCSDINLSLSERN